MEVIKIASTLINIYYLFSKKLNKQLTILSTAKPIGNIKIHNNCMMFARCNKNLIILERHNAS